MFNRTSTTEHSGTFCDFGPRSHDPAYWTLYKTILALKQTRTEMLCVCMKCYLIGLIWGVPQWVNQSLVQCFTVDALQQPMIGTFRFSKHLDTCPRFALAPVKHFFIISRTYFSYSCVYVFLMSLQFLSNIQRKWWLMVSTFVIQIHP